MDSILVNGDLPREVADALLDSSVIAVDTETSGLDWSSDRLLLCQLFAPTCGPILLRDVTKSPTQLARVLGSAQALKVFHFAPFDVRFLEAQWHTPLKQIACTKAASKLLHPGIPSAAHSLDKLLARELRVSIVKGAVRTSDWGAPNLTEEQISYASGDVIHLVDLYAALARQLVDNDEFDLYREVCDYMLTDARLEIAGVPNPLSY